MNNNAHTGPRTAKTEKSTHPKPAESPSSDHEREMPTPKFTGGFCETKPKETLREKDFQISGAEGRAQHRTDLLGLLEGVCRCVFTGRVHC